MTEHAATCNGRNWAAANEQATTVRSRHSYGESTVGQTLRTIDEKFSTDQNEALKTVGAGYTRPNDVRVPVVLRAKYSMPNVGQQLHDTNVDDDYLECLAQIRKRLADKKIWASLDETVDPKDGEVVGYVVVGTLSPDGPGETFLLAAGVLSQGGKTDDPCVTRLAAAQLFDTAMRLLWPDGGGRELLLLVSGLSAVADCETMAGWPTVGQKTVCVACVVRQLHAVSERICADYPAVDSFVSMVHRVFSKDPTRLQSEIRERAPGVPPLPALDPRAQKGRSSSWVRCASYLNENLSTVRDVLIDQPNRRQSWPVWRAGRLAIDPMVEPGLAFVDLNYGFLPATVAQIQARGVRAPLTRTVAVVFRALKKLADVTGDLGEELHRRFDDALHNNHGFRVLANIADIMAGRSVTLGGLPAHLCGNDLKYFKYAPLAAVDVRETFPQHETVFSKYNRRKYGEQSLNKLLIVLCNEFSNDDTTGSGTE